MHVCTCVICKICTTKILFYFDLQEWKENLLNHCYCFFHGTDHWLHTMRDFHQTSLKCSLTCVAFFSRYADHLKNFFLGIVKNFLLLKNIYAMCTFEFSKQKLKIQFTTKKSNKVKYNSIFLMGQKGTKTYLKKHNNSHIHTVWNILEAITSGLAFPTCLIDRAFEWQYPHGKQLQIWKNYYYSTHDTLNLPNLKK